MHKYAIYFNLKLPSFNISKYTSVYDVYMFQNIRQMCTFYVDMIYYLAVNDMIICLIHAQDVSNYLKHNQYYENIRVL